MSNVVLPDVNDWADELEQMELVLMLKLPLPVDDPRVGLLVTAGSYHTRASSMKRTIQRLEREGTISRSHDLVKFRTGELRTFMEMASKVFDSASRALTAAKLAFDEKQNAFRGYGDN